MTNGHTRQWAVLACVVALAACEDVTTNPSAAAGTYQLVEVNGEALPAVAFDGETSEGHVVATALSGTLTLRSTTFTERVVYNFVVNGADLGSGPATVTGSYELEGQLLTFDPDNDGVPTFSGTLTGGEVTTLETDPDLGVLELVWRR